MKSFRELLKRRIVWIVVVVALLSAAFITTLVLKLSGVAGTSSPLSVEAVLGILIGMVAVAFYRIRTYLTALKTPEALTSLHIKETDERALAISLKTARSTLYTALSLLGIAGLVTSFIDQTAFYTIGAALIVLVILYLVFLLYYSRRY